MQTRKLPIRRLAVWSACLPLLLALPAVAQNNWEHNSSPDFWSNAGEWSLGAVANGSTDINIALGIVIGDTSFTNSHTLTLSSSASLELDASTEITNATAGIINNSGTINSGFSPTVPFSLVNSGTINNSGTLALVIRNNGGTINNSAGSLLIGNGSYIQGGTLDETGGTLGEVAGGGVGLDGSTSLGALTIQGTFTANAGSALVVSGTIINQGSIQLVGGATNTKLFVSPGATLEGGGTVTMSGNAEIVSTVNGTTLTNVDNTIQGAGVIGDTSGNINSFQNLVNHGTINANVSGQNLLLQQMNLTNTGTLEATSGGVLFLSTRGAINNTGGSILAAGGSVVNLEGTGIPGGLTNGSVTGGTITANPFGTVSFEDGITIVGATLGTLQTTGMFTVSGTLGVLSSGQTAFLEGATLAGPVTIQGVYTDVAGAVTEVDGTLNNQGTILLSGGGGANASLTMSGFAEILQGGGTMILANTGGAGTGVINSIGSATSLTNLDNTIQGNGVISGLKLVNESAGTLLANNQTLSLNSVTFTNSGTVQVTPNNTLQLSNTSFSQTGGRTQVDGTLVSNTALLVSGGTVLGTGVIQGNVTLAGGTMQPGDPGVPGTLGIAGTYEQGAGAIFDELIDASGNGTLASFGIALDSGSLLNIDLANGFDPSGDSFDVMEALAISGTFANAPSTGFVMGGYNWTITYSPSEIILDAGSATSGGGGSTSSTPESGNLGLLGAGVILLYLSAWQKRASSNRRQSTFPNFR